MVVPLEDAAQVCQALKTVKAPGPKHQKMSNFHADIVDTKVEGQNAPSESPRNGANETENLLRHARRINDFLEHFLSGALAHLRSNSSSMLGPLYEAVGSLLILSKVGSF